jgi:hypothetical protein
MPQPYVELPTTLYLDGLDTYARRYLKALTAYREGSVPLDHPAGQAKLEKALLDVAEALLFADGVVIKTTGDNVALVLLARAFGAHATAELIRRRRIEFAGSPSDAVAMVDPRGVREADGTPAPPGNPVVGSVHYDSMEPDIFKNGCIDGEAAAAVALRRHRAELSSSEAEIRELIRRATKHTRVVPPSRLKEVIERVGTAYADGSLTPLGLSAEIAREKNEYQDHEYVALITNVALVETMLDLELDQFQMPERWSAIRKFTTDMRSGQTVLRSVDKVTELRGLPDLRALFRDGVLQLSDVPQLCVHPATEGLRRWLWSQPDPRDTAAVCSQFVGEVSGQKSTSLLSYIARFGKVAAVTFLQDRVLDALHISPEIRPGVDVGFALLSAAALERFQRRPPQAFFDEILVPRLASE